MTNRFRPGSSPMSESPPEPTDRVLGSVPSQLGAYRGGDVQLVPVRESQTQDEDIRKLLGRRQAARWLPHAGDGLLVRIPLEEVHQFRGLDRQRHREVLRAMELR